MKSRATPRFWATYQSLPPEIRQQARKAYELFSSDPSHSSLRFKKVHGGDSVYSVRISHGYRAVGLLEDDEITWVWVGSHAEYDRLLKNF